MVEETFYYFFFHSCSGLWKQVKCEVEWVGAQPQEPETFNFITIRVGWSGEGDNTQTPADSI